MKPFYRARRLRCSEGVRALARETFVEPHDLIYPMFVIEGKNKRMPVEAMPGIDRVSPDLVSQEVELVRKRGITSVLLFGVQEESQKDATGSFSWNPKGHLQTAVQQVKKDFPDVNVITDVCLCGYTDHGHCGHLGKDGGVENDPSLVSLAKTALSHAQAGADLVAPSDMMDGRVAVIRQMLDENGFENLPILSYAAKYASAFYGPFRDAAKSAPKSGDRKTYQMDPANVDQALREIEADIEEGADMVMVKPALAYLDVIRAAKDMFCVPIVAYNVSGEYSMIKAAAAKGWVDETRIVREILTSIKRAGADRIITYFAREFVRE